MKPHIRVERDETTVRTKFNGGHKWIVVTEFDIDEDDTYRESLMMVDIWDEPHIHHHQTLVTPGPCGHYRVAHRTYFHELAYRDDFDPIEVGA